MPSSHTGHFKTMLIQCATIIIQSIFGPVVCGEQTFKLNKINKRQLGKRVEIFAFVFQQLFKLKNICGPTEIRTIIPAATHWLMSCLFLIYSLLNMWLSERIKVLIGRKRKDRIDT